MNNETLLGDQQVSLIDQGSVSKETYNTIFTIITYLMYPLTFVGFVFCVFGAVVYSTKRMRSPTSIYLVALNLTELANVLITMTLETAGVIYGRNSTTSHVYLIIRLYFNICLGTAFRRATFCLSCLVSAERCIAVVAPLKSKHFKLVRYPFSAVICVTTISILFHVFTLYKFKVVPYQSPNNETLWKFQFTDTYVASIHEFDAWSVASKVIFVYLALICSLVLNFTIGITLRRHARARRSLISRNELLVKHNDRRTTITVLVSTFVFALLALPTNVSSIITNTTSDYGSFTKEHYLFNTVMRFGNLCELLSNCVGFIFYMTLSTQFRTTFYRIFCPCYVARKSPTNKTSARQSDSNGSNITMISSL